MKTFYDVLIVGAGASGLAVAYELSRENSNLNFIIIEKEKNPGRKMSAAGNGKCNLTNSTFNTDCYWSEQKEILDFFIEQHSYEEILDWFQELGIILYERDGYYYPKSNMGKQVTNHIFEQISGDIHFEEIVFEIQKKSEDIFTVQTQCLDGSVNSYNAKNIVLCTGGKAAPHLGGSESGYKLCKELNIVTEPVIPVLSPIQIEEDIKLAKGVRLDGVITLKTNQGNVYKEHGQIQFNEDNLSGICIMNLSGFVHRGFGTELCIDYFPEWNWEQLHDYIKKQIISFPAEKTISMLNAILPENFNKYLCNRLHIDKELDIEQLSQKQINKIVSSLKKMTFTAVIHSDFSKAQVTGGGVSLSEIDLASFESKQYDGMYIVGELLDVNGKCGGYNLTFAILSGVTAAKHIIQSEG